MKENLLLEQRTANARVQRVRHHYTQVSKSLKYARDIQKVRSNQAETFYQERKTNRGLSKREIERRKKALVKKKEQKEEREKKYALRRKKPKKPKSATKKQKDSSARAARPLSAAPRRRWRWHFYKRPSCTANLSFLFWFTNRYILVTKCLKNVFSVL